MGLLGKPLKINSMEIKNRFLRSATVENKADSEGYVADALLELYYALARGGTGLIVTGATFVEASGKAFVNQMSVEDDKFIPGLVKLAKIIHEYGDGCRCAVQLFHRGMSGYRHSYSVMDRRFRLSDLKEEDLLKTIVAFGQAARRVKEAGFDAVAVHGAHGYLFNQFLSPVTNDRSDQWGGSLENRMRFSLEVYSAIRRQVGDDFPVLWKLNTSDYVEGGNTIKEYVQVARRFAELGVDLIELSGISKDRFKLQAKLKEEAGAKEAYYLQSIGAMREAVGSTALAITGGIRSLPVMEEVLEKGVDLVGICRPLICEPDLPNRLLLSPDKRTSKCISCDLCHHHIVKHPVKCVEFDPFRSILKKL